MTPDELELLDEIAAYLAADDALSCPLLAPDDLAPREDPGAADAQAPKARTKRSRNLARERMRAELIALRAQSAELERRFAELSARQTVSPSDELLLASWRRVALRQRNLRVRAEMENLRLRQQLQTHTAFSQELQQATLQLMEAVSSDGVENVSISTCDATTTSSMDISAVFSNGRQPVALGTLDPKHADVFRALVGEMDAVYARTESVFEENGLRKWQAAVAASSPCASRLDTQMKSQRSVALHEGSHCIELLSASMQSYPKDAVFRTSYKCWDQLYSALNVVYVDLGLSEECMGLKSEYTIAVGSESILLVFLGVFKVISTGDSHHTVVWRSVSMETPHFPGVYVNETGWEEFRDASSADTSFHLFCSQLETRRLSDTTVTTAIATPASTSSLMNVLAASYEADMEQATMVISGLLLEEAGGRPLT